MKTAAILFATLALLGCGKDERDGKREDGSTRPSNAKHADDPSLPDAKMIARIEDLAKNSVADSNYDHRVDMKNIKAFDRYYAFSTEEGRQLVWGELYPGGRGELHIVHKNEVRYVFDGGCVAVTLFYDIKAEKFAGLYCHGLA